MNRLLTANGKMVSINVLKKLTVRWALGEHPQLDSALLCSKTRVEYLRSRIEKLTPDDRALLDELSDTIDNHYGNRTEPHGGKRKGAGRPKKLDPKLVLSIRVSSDIAHYLDSVPVKSHTIEEAVRQSPGFKKFSKRLK